MKRNYYDANAAEFISQTAELKMDDLYAPFLGRLRPGARILDAGCGSGRDAMNFLSQGFEVLAFDASDEMVKAATKLTGLRVLELRFQELEFSSEFDGVWACASLLHVPMRELPAALRRLWKSLKDEGIMYVSFKFGDFEGERNGRYFTDLNHQRLNEVLSICSGLVVVEIWETADLRVGRENEKWLNAILQKQNSAGDRPWSQ